MSEAPFFKTRMGHTFYEHTVPELVRQITRLNELLDRIVAAQERRPRDEDDANA